MVPVVTGSRRPKMFAAIATVVVPVVVIGMFYLIFTFVPMKKKDEKYRASRK